MMIRYFIVTPDLFMKLEGWAQLKSLRALLYIDFYRGM